VTTPATKEQVFAIIAEHPAQLDYHEIWELCGKGNGRHNDSGVIPALVELIDHGVIFQPYPSVCWDLTTHRKWHAWLYMWGSIGQAASLSRL